MSLILQHAYEEQDNCQDIYFWDDTGTYAGGSNEGGYGTPNIASTAVTQALLKIYAYGAETPTLFTFTVSSGTITAATITPPSGTATSILADMDSVVFPFTEALPFVITGAYLEDSDDEDTEVVSDAYYTEYSVTDGTNTYVSTSDDLFSCAACCCVATAKKELNANDCKCNTTKVMNATYAGVYLDSAIAAMEQEEVDKAHNNIVYAKELCTGDGCSNC